MKLYDDLPVKQQKFVDEYLKSGSRDDAYLKAGYRPSRRSHKANARKLYNELQGVIKMEAEKRVGSGAIRALSVIMDLMESAESESVRLQAAKDYLSRAGMDKPIESKVTLEDLRELSVGEIDEQINEIIAKAINDKSTKSIH